MPPANAPPATLPINPPKPPSPGVANPRMTPARMDLPRPGVVRIKASFSDSRRAERDGAEYSTGESGPAKIPGLPRVAIGMPPGIAVSGNGFGSGFPGIGPGMDKILGRGRGVGRFISGNPAGLGALGLIPGVRAKRRFVSSSNNGLNKGI